MCIANCKLCTNLAKINLLLHVFLYWIPFKQTFFYWRTHNYFDIEVAILCQKHMVSSCTAFWVAVPGATPLMWMLYHFIHLLRTQSIVDFARRLKVCMFLSLQEYITIIFQMENRLPKQKCTRKNKKVLRKTKGWFTFMFWPGKNPK